MKNLLDFGAKNERIGSMDEKTYPVYHCVTETGEVYILPAVSPFDSDFFNFLLDSGQSVRIVKKNMTQHEIDEVGGDIGKL